MEDVDGALGCALIDLGTGLPLAMHVASDALLDSGAMEILCAAGANYLRGEVNDQLESAMGEGPSGEGFVEEIQTTTEETYHFMCVIPGNRETVLLLVTDRTTNLGLGWVALRRTLRRVQEGTRRPARPAETSAPPLAESPEPDAPPSNPMNGNANRWKSRRGFRGR